MRRFFSSLFNQMIGSLQRSDTKGDWKDLREQAKLTLPRNPWFYFLPCIRTSLKVVIFSTEWISNTYKVVPENLPGLKVFPLLRVDFMSSQ